MRTQFIWIPKYFRTSTTLVLVTNVYHNVFVQTAEAFEIQTTISAVESFVTVNLLNVAVKFFVCRVLLVTPIANIRASTFLWLLQTMAVNMHSTTFDLNQLSELFGVSTCFLGGLSLHLNHLIASQVGICYRQFGTLPIGIFLSNLDSRQLDTSLMTSCGHFCHMSTFGDSRAI